MFKKLDEKTMNYYERKNEEFTKEFNKLYKKDENVYSYKHYNPEMKKLLRIKES